MKFETTEFTLKNGKQAMLRNPMPNDAEGLLEFLRQAASETDFIIRYPEEVTMTVEQETRWIVGSLESDYTLMLCCTVGEKIVGNCEIRFNDKIKTRHRAVVAISVLKDYWGLGIGSAMFREFIRAAEKYGVDFIELEYIEGNERARGLYEKMGFRAVSMRPNVYRLKDGSYRGEIYMQKVLK